MTYQIFYKTKLVGEKTYKNYFIELPNGTRVYITGDGCREKGKNDFFYSNLKGLALIAEKKLDE